MEHLTLQKKQRPTLNYEHIYQRKFKKLEMVQLSKQLKVSSDLYVCLAYQSLARKGWYVWDAGATWDYTSFFM